MVNWKYILIITVVAFIAEILFINYNNEQQHEKELLQNQIELQKLEEQKLQLIAAEQERQRILQEQSIQDRNEGIFNNANRLSSDYKWKLDLISEIQTRTDALGSSASRDMYLEWYNRNNEAIHSADVLATYLTENRDALDNEGAIKNWASDYLINIATNKVTLERDNQALIKIIAALS